MMVFLSSTGWFDFLIREIKREIFYIVYFFNFINPNQLTPYHLLILANLSAFGYYESLKVKSIKVKGQKLKGKGFSTSPFTSHFLRFTFHGQEQGVT